MSFRKSERFPPENARASDSVPIAREIKMANDPLTSPQNAKAKKIEYLLENVYIAEQLDTMSTLLAQQNASFFRVRAYSEAAKFVRSMTQPIRSIYEESGSKGLDALPKIGISIANAIVEILESGELSSIKRLRGTLDPEKLFQTVPTIGPQLAKSIHDQLSIDSLEALEAAANDGRLSALTGIGPRRLSAIKGSLKSILATRHPSSRTAPNSQPPVATILEVDQAYRTADAENTLSKISLQRPGTTDVTKVPILHTERDGWRFTAIYSNTRTAQTFKRTRDWVMIYFEEDGHGQGQCTVVTEHHGPLIGKRVIRGSEDACAEHYLRETADNLGG